ncbi:MAG: spore maturation protein [Clostridia bacterium]|nr:spore maturation protein [Clostridia bacterium]
MDKLGIYAVPAIIAAIVVFGAVKRIDLFEAFREGAKEGISSLISIAPSLIGLVIAVNMLSASGFFDIAAALLSPVCNAIGFPAELLPLGLIRPVSGSGSFAVLSSVLEKYGPDSIIGKTASVMAGSTETTFYAVAVYYGSVGIRKTRWTIPCALAADLTGMLFAVWTVRLFS